MTNERDEGQGLGEAPGSTDPPSSNPTGSTGSGVGDDQRGRWMLVAILAVSLVTLAVLAIVLVDDGDTDASGSVRTAATDEPETTTTAAPDTGESDAGPRPDEGAAPDGVDCTQVAYTADAGPVPAGWETTMQAARPDDPRLPDEVTGVLGVFAGDTTTRAIFIVDGWDSAPPGLADEPLQGPAPVEATDDGATTWSEVALPDDGGTDTACRVTVIGIGTTPDDLLEFSAALAPQPPTP